MPFTLIHGLISYFFAVSITKDKRLWVLGFIAGVLPDLDGLPILFDLDLFYAIHHELFHEPIYGILLAIPIALILKRKFAINEKMAFTVFSIGLILHPITDVLFTNWPVKLLWPLSNEQFSFQTLINYSTILSIGLVILFILQIVFEYTKKNS